MLNENAAILNNGSDVVKKEEGAIDFFFKTLTNFGRGRGDAGLRSFGLKRDRV